MNEWRVYRGCHSVLSWFTRDPTERKGEDRELRDRETRLREAERLGHVGAWEWDFKKNLVKCSDEFFRILGLAPGEVVAYEDYLAVLHPEDRESQRHAMDEMIREGRSCDTNCRIVRSDGEIRTIHVLAEVEHPGCGLPRRVFGFVQDITERRQAEQEQRISEARSRRAIEANKDGLWEWNILTNEEFFSSGWWEISGFSGVESPIPRTYRSWAERIHPDDKDRVERALADHLEKGTTYDIDYRHRHKSDEYRWQNSKGKAFFDEGGRPTKMVVSISDITERKRVEVELKRRAEEFALENRLLQQSDRIKAKFLAQVFHKIRTQLDLIMGLASQLRQTPTGADGRASQFAADIETSGREISALVNDVSKMAGTEFPHAGP